MIRFYTLSYDAARLGIPHEKFIVYIKNNRLVEDWNSPFDGCIILTSRLGAREISASIYDFIGTGCPFLVSEMADCDVFGAVPDQVWEWFSKPRPGFRIEMDEGQHDVRVDEENDKVD